MKQTYSKPSLAVVDGTKLSPAAAILMAGPKLRGELSRALPVRAAIRGPVKNGGRGIPLLARGKSEAPRQWFSVKNEAKSEFAEISLYDEIGEDWFGEGDSAKSFKEALNGIPKGRKILVRINSPGGNVYDGIAMYKLLRERAADVTTQIDGIALSIASVIALGGSKVIIARTGQFMAHDPWTAIYVQGTEDDIAEEARLATDALRAAKKSIVVAYTDRTGKSEDDVRALMKATSWYVGDEAKSAGFVDEVSDEEAISNNFDLSGFKLAPEAFRKLNNSAAQKRGGHSLLMNRSQIIARLKKMGITVDDNSTDEQLIAQLDAAIEARQIPTPPAAKKDDDASAPTTVAENRLKKIEDDLREERELRAEERKTRITKEVGACVEQRRIVAAQADAWVARALKDETILTDLKAMPQQLPEAGLSVECVSESIHDICKHAKNLRQQINYAIQNHGEVAESVFARNNKSRTAFIQKNVTKLIELWNAGTNTIDSDLKQDVLLTQALQQFKRILMPLMNFTKNIGSVPVRGTTTIRIPYVAEDTVASTTWNSSNGYVAGDTAIEERSLTLTRYYKAVRFTADELRRQPYLDINATFQKAAEQLAYDVWKGFLAVITAANYNVTVTNYTLSGVPVNWPMASGAFDTNVVADLRNVASQAQWPFPGRVLIVNGDYDSQLMKDNAIKNAMAGGTASVVQDGVLTKIFGFNYGTNPNWPTNSENMVGCIAQANAVLIGASPIQPTDAEMRAGLLYQLVSDAELGISLEYKDFGEPQMNREFRIIEANWAAGKGNEKNLFRLTSA